MLPVLWIVFVLFSSSCVPYVASSLDCFCFVFIVLCTLCCQFSGLFLFCFHRLVYPMLPVLWIVFVLFSSSCVPYVASSLDCFCFVFIVLCTLCCQFSGLFLFCFHRLVYPMLPVLWIVHFCFVFIVLCTLCCQFSGLYVFVLFSSSCVPYVASSLDCPFLFCFHRLVYPMLPVLWIVRF